MKVWELLDNSECIQVQIIQKVLLNRGSITIERLQEELNITNSTVIDYTDQIKEHSLKFKGKINWYLTEDCLTLATATDFSVSQLLENYYHESINIRLIYHLYNEKEITTIKLTDILAISSSSVYRRTKEINEIISEYEVKIKNNQFSGSELQIRYFLYQLFTITGFNKINKVTSIKHLNNQIISTFSLENNLSLKDGLVLWLQIGDKRFQTHNEQSKLTKWNATYLFLESSQAFKILKNSLNRYYSRYAIKLNDGEVIYTLIFLLTKFEFCSLEPNNLFEHPFIPLIKEVEKVNQETIACFNHKYNMTEVSASQIEKLTCELTSIHLQLLYFKGYTCYFDSDELRTSVNQILENKEQIIANNMLNVALDELKITPSADLQAITYYKYILVLADILLKSEIQIKIGIDIQGNYFQRRVAMAFVEQIELPNVLLYLDNPYQDKIYDVIITNVNKDNIKYRSRYIYQLTNFKSEYDMKELNQLIVNIAKEKRGKK